jgi:drug/metabolite transporter (DMT)-like permease
MALVGVYVGLSKALVAAVPVLVLAGLRFGIAGVAMLPWLRRAPGEPRLAPTDHATLFGLGFVGQVLFTLCMLEGVKRTGALAAGVAMAALPAAVALASRVFLAERLEPRVVIAALCAAAGIAGLALARAAPEAAAPAPAGAGGDVLGWALLLGAVACEAGYVVMSKRMAARVAPRRVGALMNAWALVLTAPLAIWQAHAIGFEPGALAPLTWAGLVFYALAASVVSVWLWVRGLQQVPASRAGVFSVLLPVAAAAVGVLALGEPFGPLHALAFGLALAGVLLATWPAAAR